jgi:hypothetical protein
MNFFPLIILFIVGVNVLKQIAEKNKQAQEGTQQRKQLPRLLEGEDEMPTRRPEQQQGQAGAGSPPSVFGTGPRDTVFDQWFEGGQQEDDRVAWEAEREAVAEFLGVSAPLIPPVIPVVQEVKPKPVPVRVEPKPEEMQRPTIPAARSKRRPARKRAARVPADVLPAGIFGSMDDVRRGIIMSEILGPPTGLK